MQCRIFRDLLPPQGHRRNHAGFSHLAAYYKDAGFHVLTLDEYVDLVIRCLEISRPDLVIHRLTGDGPKDLLIAPLWSQAKRQVLNTIHRELKNRDTYQGRLYTP